LTALFPAHEQLRVARLGLRKLALGTLNLFLYLAIRLS
jgi:hypothetical protein